MKKTINFLIYIIFISFFIINGCTCNQKVKINLLAGQDSLRNAVAKSVHMVKYEDISYINLENHYKYVKGANIDSVNDIKLFCKSLNKKIDTARTDRNYDVVNVYDVLLVKKDSSEIKFQLMTSNKNGIFTTLCSDGWEGWVYGGYRVDNKIMKVLKKYSLEK